MTEETKLQETEAPAAQEAEATAAESGSAAAEEITEAQAPEQSADAGESAEEEQNLDSIKVLKKGEIVLGKIVKVEDNQALVDIGYKYDGILPIREMSSLHVENADAAVSVGQEVECKILSIDDNKENLILSKRAVDSTRAWQQLQERFEQQEVFEAVVADVVKGGLVVDLGVRGFIPASMVERHFVEDFSEYKGRTLRLRIKELDEEKNKVILSQKDVLDEEYNAQKMDLFAKLQVGEVLEGAVQRLTPFGAFVDIGGVDGLVHISEIAWHHVEHPSELLQEGQKVKVKVLKLDPDNERISLSIKASQPGPWEQAESQFNIGDTVEGEVKRLVTFGAFVEIAPGVEGLVHISQISHKHIGTPQEVLEEGQNVKVKILDFNVGEKRASLSIKETEEAPVEQPRREKQQETINNENVSLNNQGLSFTLGERFGDKLNKLK